MEKKDFDILNRHGKRMPTTHYLPKNEIKGTCIALHGLGGWKDQSVVVAAATAALENDYQVFAYNSANSALAPDADFFTSTTTKDREDLEDMVAYVRADASYVAPLILIGHSMGGLVAMEYVVRRPGEVERLIVCAPGGTWRRFFSGFFLASVWWYLTNHHYTPGPFKMKLRLGRKWLVDLFRYDEFTQAKKIQIPVLIVAAGKDTTVAIPARLKKFVKRFAHGTYAEIPTAPHTFFKHEAELTGILTKWLTQS